MAGFAASINRGIWAPTGIPAPSLWNEQETRWRRGPGHARGTPEGYRRSAEVWWTTFEILNDNRTSWRKTNGSKRARAFIRDHPGAFARLFLRKLFYFWWCAPTTGLLYPRPWLWAYLTYYVGVVLLAAAGVWRIVRVDTRRPGAAADSP